MTDWSLGPDKSDARADSPVDAMGLGIVFERSATAMCVLDDEGRIARANDALCKLLDRDRCELSGVAWSELTHAEHVAPEDPRMSAVLERHTSGYEHQSRMVRGDGSLVCCRQTLTRLDEEPEARTRVLVEVVDTTVEHELAEKHRASQQRAGLAIAAAQDAFVGMDSAGVITEWNSAAESMFGWQADEAIGRSLAETIVPEGHREAHTRGLSRYLESGEGPVINKKVEVTALRRDGVEFQVELTVWPVIGRDGLTFNAFLRDASERQRFQEELRQLAIAATTDQGTGLKNRRGFFALAEHEMSVAHRLGQSLTLIFFDIDRLKEINDTLGHLEGDRAIADAARILTGTFRESDLVARLGGDEFCVLALGPREGFSATLRRFEAAVEEHNRTAERPYELSLSYGVSFYDPAKEVASLDLLMSEADASMYESKLRRRSA